MPEIVDIRNYQPKASDVFLFDNSVWMYLFCPLGNYNKNKQKHYSSFFKLAQSSQSTIFINSMVISEFSNRYLRLDFEEWKKAEKKYSADYKRDFIGTERYTSTVEDLQISINKIMQTSEKGSDNFNAIDLSAVGKHLANIDFNDSYLLELAKLNNYAIVTDDQDFVKYKQHKVRIVICQ
jgi:predicted nucleic acid-binding protein